MSRYEAGTFHKVLRPSELWWQYPIEPYVYGFRKNVLAIGDVIECTGYGYSGGSDGIQLPKFKTWDQIDQRWVAAEFHPNSWGSPMFEWLEQSDALATAAGQEASRQNRG